MIAPLEAEIRRRCGDCVYGEGVDYSLPHAVKDALARRGETVCFAESCTGGMIASQLVACPGASDVREGELRHLLRLRQGADCWA